MTKTLIIYAHPKTPGHNPLVLEHVKTGLEKRNETYDVLDLYAMNYDPVLHEEELANKQISKENKEIQKKIRDAQKLIFIYPVWWGAMPAILKGFIDKTFTSGFAFKYVNHRPVGLLQGKKAIVLMTSGAPKIYSKYFLGNRYQKSVKHDILEYCGIKTKVFQTDNAIELDEKQKTKIEKNVKNGLQWLYR